MTTEKRKEPFRKFLGKVGNKVSDFSGKGERAFEQAHLKAYLNGNTHFHYGYHSDALGIRHHTLYEVKEQKL